MQIDGQGATPTDTGSSSGSDGMTAAELAYFSSGGKDTAALDAEWARAGTGGAQDGSQSSGGGEAGSDKAAASDAAKGASGDQDPDDGDDDGEEVVVLGKDGKPRAQNGRFVPHQALHKERTRRKAAEGEAAEAKVLAARANERIQVFTELIQKSMTPAEQQAAQDQHETEDPAPDPEKDIFAYVKWQARQIERMQKALTEKTSKFEQHTEEQQFRQRYFSDAASFNSKTPDFRDAYMHLVTGYDRELEALGMKDAAARRAHIAKEERNLAQMAIQQGMSPSQVLYNLAKARGYAGAKPPEQKDAGADKQPAANQDHMKKIEQIANGQKVAGNPLSSAGGSSGEGLTVEAFLNMNESEYAAAVSRLSPSQRRALLGG